MIAGLDWLTMPDGLWLLFEKFEKTELGGVYLLDQLRDALPGGDNLVSRHAA